MRFGLLLLLVSASGCFAQLGGDEAQSQTAPDASMATGGSGSPTGTPGDAGAVDSGSMVAASCAAKGYAAPTGLTSLYRVSATSAKWIDAAAACNADVPGATHLVVLSTQAEVDYIKMTRGWIGLSDRANEGVFLNVTLEPNDQRPYLSGQPDNGSGSEDCVQMKADGLDDDQCGNTHTYVCECDGRAAT